MKVENIKYIDEIKGCIQGEKSENSGLILDFLLLYKRFDKMLDWDIFSRGSRMMREYAIFSTKATPEQVLSTALKLADAAESHHFEIKIGIKLKAMLRGGIVVAKNLIYDVISDDITETCAILEKCPNGAIICDLQTYSEYLNEGFSGNWKPEDVIIDEKPTAVAVYRRGVLSAVPPGTRVTGSRRRKISLSTMPDLEEAAEPGKINLKQSESWLKRVENYGMISLKRKYLFFYRFDSLKFEDFFLYTTCTTNARLASFVSLVFSLSALTTIAIMGDPENTIVGTRNAIRIISYAILVALLLIQISTTFWRAASVFLGVSLIISIAVLYFSLLIVKRKYVEVAINIFYMTQILGFWIYPLEFMFRMIIAISLSYALGYVTAYHEIEEVAVYKYWYRILVPVLIVPMLHAEFMRRRLFQLDWITEQVGTIQHSLRDKTDLLLQSIYPSYLKEIFMNEKKDMCIYENVDERLLFTKYVEMGSFCNIRFDFSECKAEDRFQVVNEVYQWLENQLDTTNFGIHSDNGSLSAITYSEESASDCIDFILLVYAFIRSNPSLKLKIFAGIDSGGFHAILGEKKLFDSVDVWSVHRCCSRRMSLWANENTIALTRRSLEKWRDERMTRNQANQFDFAYEEVELTHNVQACIVKLSELARKYGGR